MAVDLAEELWLVFLQVPAPAGAFSWPPAAAAGEGAGAPSGWRSGHRLRWLSARAPTYSGWRLGEPLPRNPGNGPMASATARLGAA